MNPHPVLIATLFSRLKAASEAGKKYTMILGNPEPETYEAGFAHSMLKYFVYQIDPKLRMPLENVHYPTNKNIADYSTVYLGSLVM